MLQTCQCADREKDEEECADMNSGLVVLESNRPMDVWKETHHDGRGGAQNM